MILCLEYLEIFLKFYQILNAVDKNIGKALPEYIIKY